MAGLRHSAVPTVARHNHFNAQEDVEMKPATIDMSYESGSSREQSSDEVESPLTSTAALRNVSALYNPIEDLLPRTITPSRVGPGSQGTSRDSPGELEITEFTDILASRDCWTTVVIL
ncbi:hypothetical protein B0H21DRAFT_846324 [Amylocystis lapponica]|nr:hypothetical protein B0H21DRAFT_846324 [Amylocystis lapponica]